MERGDISAGVPPKFIFLFENLIGIHQQPWSRAQEATYLRLRQWRKAVYTWDIAETMLAHIYDFTWRHQARLDIAVCRPQGFVDALEQRFDREGIPVNGFHSFHNTNQIAQTQVNNPAVMTIFFADPALEFTFGGKGRLVRNGGWGEALWM